MKSSVEWCVGARQDARCVTTILHLLQPMNPIGLGLLNRMKVAYPRRMLMLSLNAARVVMQAKRVRGSGSPPLLTN